MNTQKENLTKPPSYAREEKDQHQYEIRISPGNSPEFNNPIISIKGISTCFECQNNNIKYDIKHDEIYCHPCGLILRQGLQDYTPYPEDTKRKKEHVLGSGFLSMHRRDDFKDENICIIKEMKRLGIKM